jgi:hypothetical protein
MLGIPIRNQEGMMSLFYLTQERADLKQREYGFALVLICVALALVLASVMFPDVFRPSGEFSLIGP